ncbi:uncharacterized protein LOC142897026 [Nelusetta ayraudi]|uniref:uncharacterized protein LOC142897026 n=1 Tax=Nelusetta ayraudi TaxID=303726 RepID=UPI003F72DBFF
MERFYMDFHQTLMYHLTLQLLHLICSYRASISSSKGTVSSTMMTSQAGTDHSTMSGHRDDALWREFQLAVEWKILTKEEQAKYFMAAEKERILHALQHPDWSFKHNYGKRKLRNRKNRKAIANLKKAAEKCMAASFVTIVPPTNVGAAMLLQHLQPNHSSSPPLQPANQDQGMILQHLQPNHSSSPPLQPANQDQGMILQHLQPNHSSSPPLQPANQDQGMILQHLQPNHSGSPPLQPANQDQGMILQHLWPTHSGSPPLQPANQDQGMILQHLQPTYTGSPPLQLYQDIHTVDFEQIQIKNELNM